MALNGNSLLADMFLLFLRGDFFGFLQVLIHIYKYTNQESQVQQRHAPGLEVDPEFGRLAAPQWRDRELADATIFISRWLLILDIAPPSDQIDSPGPNATVKSHCQRQSCRGFSNRAGSKDDACNCVC